MTADVELAAHESARALAERLAFVRRPVRAVEQANGVIVIVQVVPAGGTLLTAAGERKARRLPARGERCRNAILDLVRAERRPLLGLVITNKMKGRHSASGVKKALAELTTAGLLLNDDDGTGYRLPGSTPPAETGTLFDDG